jgi:nitrate reductase / nitrite oxidoreductase, beta subunit
LASRSAADYAYPNVGEDDCFGSVENGAFLSLAAQMLVLLPGAHLQPLHLSGLPVGLPAVVHLQAPRGRHRPRRPVALPRLPGVRQAPARTRRSTSTRRRVPSEKCIACFPKIEQGVQPQCFVNCIGKIRLQGWISTPEQAREDNPMDYLVHVRKVALPLYPQFGLEPNVYYIPSIHTPVSFNEQLFGPGAAGAIKTYRDAISDKDLAGLLCMFGSTEALVSRWRRAGDLVSGFDEKGSEVVRVPLDEPVYVRSATDARNLLVRTNCP